MLHRLAHLQLGFGIERGGGLVEQDDRRILDQRARNGHALALAAGKLCPMFADRRVVAAREGHDEIMRIGALGGRDDLVLAGARFSEFDVFADRAAEQKRVLPDIGDVLAQRAARHLGDILLIDDDLAALGVIEAQDQVEHGRFAAARGPDQRGQLARLGHERYAAQHRFVAAIGEMNVVEFQPRRLDLQGRLVVVDRFARRAVDHLEQDAHAHQPAVELDVETGKALGRFVGQQERGDEGEELPGRGAGLDDAIAGIDKGEGDRAAAERLHQRARAIGDARHLVGFMLDVRDIAVEALAHDIFEREGLDDVDALQRFLQRLHDARAAMELAARDGVDAADHLAQNQERRRYDHEAEERHHRVLHHHHRHQSDQRQQIASDRGDQQIDHLRGRGGAGGQPRDEFGRMAVGEKAEALVEQLGEHGALIVSDDPVADARKHHALAVSGEPFGGKQYGDECAERDDAGEITVDVGLIDDIADQIGAHRRAGGGNRHQGEGDRVFAPMHEALFGQQSPDQGKGAVTLVVGRWQDVLSFIRPLSGIE